MNSRTVSPQPSPLPWPVAERVAAWWRRGRARLATKPRRIVLMTDSGGIMSDVAAAADAVLASFDDWCRAHEGCACELALSGAWLLTCVSPVDWSDEAAHEQAVQQWAHYAGIEPHALDADWLLRTLKAPNARLACAMPRVLMQGLADVARAHGVQLAAVRPWWLAPAQAWLDGLAAATPADASIESWQLDLIEPGLVTRLRASRRGMGITLDALWSEAGGQDAASNSELGGGQLATTGIHLDPPTQDADAAWQRHVWAGGDLHRQIGGAAA